jgi:hypothetical protein
LLKYTPVNLHKDAENVELALDSLRAVAQQINEGKRHHDDALDTHEFVSSHMRHVGTIMRGKTCGLCERVIISAQRKRSVVKCKKCAMFAHQSCSRTQGIVKSCSKVRPPKMSPAAKKRLSRVESDSKGVLDLDDLFAQENEDDNDFGGGGGEESPSDMRETAAAKLLKKTAEDRTGKRRSLRQFLKKKRSRSGLGDDIDNNPTDDT